MTGRTMEDQGLAAAHVEEDEVHNMRLDAHRTELEDKSTGRRLRIRAGRGGRPDRRRAKCVSR
jgi:hypothetical protein